MNWKTRDSGFWHPGLPTPPPSSFTPGVIPLLKRALRRSIDRGKTQRAVVCHHRAIHVSNEMFDRTWGCGYRNFLMACAILMVQEKQPAYAALLQRPWVPPSVRNLQRWIEEAWAAGFDREGAQQLKKLVGTGKWIGTADLWVAFACRGIPAELVDFNLKNQPNADPVIRWIKQYFDPPNSPIPAPTDVNTALMNSSPIVSTDKMPIILQYNGHSQTIVGYEQMRDGSNQQGPSRNQQTGPLNPHTGAQEAEGRHPHAHKIKDFIQHGSLRKQGKRRAPESPPNQRATQRHAGEDGQPPRSGGANPASGQGTNPSGVTPTGGNALAPRGGASAPKQDLDWGQTMRFFRKDGKQLNKKDSYQILYFPLTPPLTETEKMRRRVVYSTRIC
ncbi:peptidase family C78-domain-containing protein [Schizophyllum commune]